VSRSASTSTEDKGLLATGTPESNFACSNSGHLLAAGKQVRWKHASSDLDFPPVPFPSRRIFAMAGEARLRTLVMRGRYGLPLRQDGFASCLRTVIRWQDR